MMPFKKSPISRRALLRQSACGFGMLGLRGLLAAEEARDPLAPKLPHIPARAKRAIFLFMHGGPSHLDIYDPKPRLERDHGKPLPFKRPLTFAEEQVGGVLKSPFAFKQHGESGIPLSELFPNLANHVDEMCIIRSMVGDSVAHGGALMQLHTGTNTFTRPSWGSWVVYGLGTENQNLPGFITLKPTLFHGGAKNYSAGFLPAAYEGTAIGYAALGPDDLKQPIQYLERKGMSPDLQRFELDMLQKMNRRSAEQAQFDPQLEGRVQAFELAARMQTEAPESFNINQESEATKKLYGLDNEETRDFGWQCLVARRLSERGVRFVQASHTYRAGNPVGWDAHSKLIPNHVGRAKQVDQPISALLTDMKARGLLDDTLIVWSGEFGRTPVAQSGDGRDHNPYGYTSWMAGAGVKHGFIYGATDEFGYHAVEDRMHIHDLHATVLHILGLNHKKLTYFHGGRDFRLTDVAGNVAEKLLA
jgi:hypothetical protein